MRTTAVRFESRPIDYELLWGQLSRRLRELQLDVAAHFTTCDPAELRLYQGRHAAFDEALAEMQSLRQQASGMPPAA